MKIGYEKLSSKSKLELAQIVEMEKKEYGNEHKLASLDMIAQVPDEHLGSPGIIIVAKDMEKSLEENVVGYFLGLYGQRDDFCFVANLVIPEYRGCGLGTKLKCLMIEEAAKSKSKGYATVWPGNITNITLNLNKLNWVVTGWSPLKYGTNPQTDHRFYIQGELKNEAEVNENWKNGLFDSAELPAVFLPIYGQEKNHLEEIKKLTEIQELKRNFAIPMLDSAQNYSFVDWKNYQANRISNINKCIPGETSYLLFVPKTINKEKLI